MNFRSFGVVVFVLFSVTLSHARKPAVEDFVGIDIEHPRTIPQGTESLFNFEKEITRFEEARVTAKLAGPKNAPLQAQSPQSVATWFVVAFLLGLPAISWMLVMNRMRQKAHIASASNIEVLEKYRRQRGEQNRKSQEEEYRKVS